MHSLEVIDTKNKDQVLKEMADAIADDTASGYVLAHKIAKANPDLFLHDGRVRERHAVLYDENLSVLHSESAK